MRAIASLIAATLLLAASGCSQNPFASRESIAVEQDQAQQQQYLAKVQELQQRANSLDTNNSELHGQLARSQQQSALLQKQVDALRQELGDKAHQLAQMQQSKQQIEQQVQVLQASTQRRGGAIITANNSRTGALTAIELPGVTVRQDGDVVRIELPTDQLFLRGTATPHQGAPALLGPVIDAVQRSYSRQLIGVEAHTDNEPAPTTMWQSNHQLTTAQAMAVFGELSQRYNMNPRQLLVVGHGANHPVASNGTLAGKARNRRVELVVYPETVDGS